MGRKSATSIALSELTCIFAIESARSAHMPQHDLVPRMIFHVSGAHTRSHTFKLGFNRCLQLSGTIRADRTHRVDVRVTARGSLAAKTHLCRGLRLAGFRYRSSRSQKDIVIPLLGSFSSTLMRCVHKFMLLVRPLNTPPCLSESHTEKPQCSSAEFDSQATYAGLRRDRGG